MYYQKCDGIRDVRTSSRDASGPKKMEADVSEPPKIRGGKGIEGGKGSGKRLGGVWVFGPSAMSKASTTSDHQCTFDTRQEHRPREGKQHSRCVEG